MSPHSFAYMFIGCAISATLLMLQESFYQVTSTTSMLLLRGGVLPKSPVNNKTYLRPVSSYQNPLQDQARVWTQITFSAEYDQELLPHTIRHYLNVGLSPDTMLITLHHQDPDAPELQQAQDLLRNEFGIPHVQTWHGNFTSQKNCDMRQQHRQAVGVDDCDWILKLDADELLRVPGNDMITFLESLGMQNFDSVSANWVDRVAPQGQIPNISDESVSLADQFPVGCHRFSQLAGDNATTFKVVAFRGFHREKRAGHRLAKLSRRNSCRYPVRLFMDHYKWSWPVVNKLQRRMAHYKAIEGFEWWTESQAFLNHLDEHGGRIDIQDPQFACQDYSTKDAAVPMATVESFWTDEVVDKEPVDVAAICQRPMTCPIKLVRPSTSSLSP